MGGVGCVFWMEGCRAHVQGRRSKTNSALSTNHATKQPPPNNNKQQTTNNKQTTTNKQQIKLKGEDIAPGDELFYNYRYDLDNAPDWAIKE